MKTTIFNTVIFCSALVFSGCSEDSSENEPIQSVETSTSTIEDSDVEITDSDVSLTDTPEADEATVDTQGPADPADLIDPNEPMMTLLTGETMRGFADGVGREARFRGITCMTIAPDGGALYVSDTFNGIVRRIDTDSGEVKTIGGKALSFSTSDGMGELVRFTEPRGIGVTSDGGLLWVADGPSLRSLDPVSGEAITWAGIPGEPGFVDGDSVDARIGFLVHDIEVSEDGQKVFLSDRSNDRIRVWDAEEETLSSIAGGGPIGADGVGTSVGFNGNGGVVRDGTMLYIADTFSHTLRQLDLNSGEVTTIAGQTGLSGSTDGDLSTARLDAPQGLTIKNGVLYAGGFDGQIRTVDTSVNTMSTLPLTGLTGTFSPPVADPVLNRLYYADLSTEAVFTIDLDTNEVNNLAGPVEPAGNVDGGLGDARFGWIYGLEPSANGERLFVADPSNASVRVIDLTAGQVSSITHEGWESPVGLALDEANQRLFVGDASTGRLWIVALADDSVTPLGKGALDMPWGMAFTGDTLYVAEHEGLKILSVDINTGQPTTLTGTGLPGSENGAVENASFQGPLGISWDDTTNVLYVADYSGNTIRAVDVNEGTVSTVAGDGIEGSADGLPGGLNQPSGVLVRDGNLLITDTGNHTVRSWTPETGLTTLVGQPGTGASIGAGAGIAISEATLTQPEALASGQDGLYISVEYAIMHVPWEALEAQENP